MSDVKIPKDPSYRLHKPSKQAVVSIEGKDFYLGPYGSESSRRAYDRLVGEWRANGRHLRSENGPAPITVTTLIARYWDHAKTYYKKGGKPTSEQHCLKQAMRPLKRIYGETFAGEFRPSCLIAIQNTMVGFGWARGTVNHAIHRIRRIFSWGVANDLIPPSVAHGLREVPNLQAGRTDAKEPPRVKPVPQALIEAVLPQVSDPVAAMIEIQLLSGMRPGEVVIMRRCDLDTSGECWTYTPSAHKTEHHQYDRTIHIGPQAREIVKRFFKPDLDAFLFTPTEAEAIRSSNRRAKRVTPMTPSQSRRRLKRRFNARYDVASYRRLIRRACDRAFPPPGELARRQAESLADWKARLSPEERTEVRRLKKAGLALPPHLARRKGETSSEHQRRLTPEQQTALKTWRREHCWHPHQLRHNAATKLRKEFSLEVARVVLGHHSELVTKAYAEQDNALARDAMNRVG